MAWTTTLHAIAATIFIAANVIVSQTTDISKEDHRNPVPPTSSKDNLMIEPLPSDIFHPPLTNLLSPELFSQPSPLGYLLEKATTISEFQTHRLCFVVEGHLIAERFPQPYIPYAKFLSSLFACLSYFRYVKSAIIDIQDAEEFSHPALPSDIPPPDNRFLTLFSEEIFEDENPPSVVLLVLLHIPKDKIDEAVIWLRKLLNSKNDFSQYYRGYIKHLYNFLNGLAGYQLNILKKRIAELKRTTFTLNSSNFD